MSRRSTVRPSRRKRPHRALELGVAAALLAAWFLTLAPTSIGGPATYVVIRGESMLPTFEGGDLVLVRSADAYGAGDVVAYRVPAGEPGEGLIVIHRIVQGDPVTGFVFLGDNNPAPDPWRPRTGDLVGTAWVRIPYAGRVVALLHQPAVLGALAASLVVLLFALRWRPSPLAPRRQPAPAPATVPIQ
jgi:signal peptidase I